MTQKQIIKVNTNVNTEINKYRDKKGVNNALKQKEKTKLEKKIDINKSKRPIAFNENQTKSIPIQVRVNTKKY